ncbi:MAG: PAS domain S-box protein [Burkholderiaceae bacterium]
MSAISSERSVRAEAELARLRTALRDSEQRYQTLFNLIDEGFCLIEMLFDADGKPHDYRFIEINHSFEALTGLKQVLGKTAREVIPNFEERSFEIYGAVAVTGEPARFVDGSEKTGYWFDVHAFRVDTVPKPTVALRFTNISDRRRDEAALRDSQQRLQTAMDAAHMYSWEMDLQTRQVTWSDNHKEVLGFALPASFEETILLVHPDDRASTQHAVQRAVELNAPYRGDCRITNPNNGEIVWCDWQGATIGAQGGPRRFVGITQNVTARKRTEKALLASNARLRMLISQSTAGIVEADLRGRFTFANERFCQLTDYSESELLQLSIRDITHPDDVQSTAERFEQLARGGADYILEKRYVRKDGSIVWVSNSVAGMRDEDGRVRSVMAVTIDITARRVAEQGQQQADARKDEFLAVLAHELRNPLAPIRNAAQIMQRVDARQPVIASAIALIDRQTRHLTRLVDDLLDVSRINLGKIDLRKERIDVGSVVQNALETSRPLIDAAGHRLAISVPEDPVFVDADSVRLAQVFSNLLNNAAKYTEHGGSIELIGKRDGDEAVISIRDSGVGIAPEMLPHVFQMFVQVDRSLERSRSGLGIGLALAQRIVEMHGGTLTARSSGVVGEGSEFVVRLPVSLAVLPGAGVAQSPVLNGDSQKSRGRRILVADDNEDSVESLALLLSIDGNEVRTALDGRAAVEAVSGFDPDMVVLDIGMPKMNGYDAARAIRRQSSNKDIVLIALTGWGQEDVKRQCEEAGFNGHLVKPADYTALKRLIADLPTARVQ